MKLSTRYHDVGSAMVSLCEGERDTISLMATVSCELFHAFKHFDWVGFYRAIDEQTLKIGPYQGGHGCLTIPFDRGVCGACARTRKTIIVPNVEAFEDHIACSSSTRSEIVLPVFDSAGKFIAVLDIDSDQRDAFDDVDGRDLGALLAHIFAGAA